MTFNDRVLAYLAAAHVLGTLPPRTRRRFERLTRTDPRARAALVTWEERLTGLSGWVPQVRPDPRTWTALLARLTARDAPVRRVPAWRNALAAGFVVATLAIGWTYYSRVTIPVYTAVMIADDGQGLWDFSATAAASRVTVHAHRPDLVPPDRSFELWAVPDGGGAPVSLGLITSDEYTYLMLHDEQRRALRSARALAVTVEPPGGSPTGVATGRVIRVSEIARRS